MMVNGEDDDGIPPVSKNLSRDFLEEYFWRPSGIVCYDGGVRAAMPSRVTQAELGMSGIPSIFPVPRRGAALAPDGRCAEACVDRRLGRLPGALFPPARGRDPVAT